MKNSLLFKTAVLGAASALTIGAAVAPFTSFASETTGEVSAQHNGPRGGQRHGVGLYGAVTAVNDAGDGTGTITFALGEPTRPADAPALDEDMIAKIQARIDAFFEEHPNAPRPGDSVTVAYDSETKFMIGGEESSAADVSVGTTIYVMGAKPNSGEAAKAISDSARAPRGEAGQHHERPRGVRGEVVSVDTDANTVTITLPDERDGAFSVGQQVHVGAFVQLDAADDSSEE